jgi:hypothetical protein
MVQEATYNNFPEAIKTLEKNILEAERECKFMSVDGDFLLRLMRADVAKAKKWVYFATGERFHT